MKDPGVTGGAAPDVVRRRHVFVLAALVAVVLSLVVAPARVHADVAADPSASASTRAVADWLAHLRHRAGNRVVSGHFGGYSGGTFALGQIETLHDRTGQYPGVLACDYAGGWNDNGTPADWHDNYPTTIDHSCNPSLIAWWKSGGLVSVSVHGPNPADPKDFHSRLADFAQLSDPSTALGSRWRDQLDQVAAGLRELDEAGVPVLFRPMHEMNGAWFWWGGQSPSAFTRVWRAMFDYLTTTKGLHNLLWVYAPDCGPQQRTAYYPGSDVTDVVGLDCYTDTPASLNGYDELLTLGKPFAFTEMGVGTTGDFDFRAWIEAIRTRFPATAYFLTWDSVWSPVKNQYATELMNDSWTVNRGEIDLAARTEPGGTPITGPSTPLADFESGTQEWTGYKVKNGPWSVTEWAAQGTHSLKADIDLGTPESYLLHRGRLDLSGYTAITAFARTAPWGNHAGGTTAKLYVRTGDGLTWRDSGSAVAGPDGVTLTLPLAGISGLNDVREIGVRFAAGDGAGGGTSIYLDQVSLVRPAMPLADFESGTQEWTGYKVKNGPWSVTEWAAQGTHSLKADIDLGTPESYLLHRGHLDLSGYTALSATIRTAPWGNHAGGTTAKLYVRTGDGLTWRDSGSVVVGSDGVKLWFNLVGSSGLNDVREIGVHFAPAAGAGGQSAIYADAITLR
ncbi:glycosyl hydrolase [Streptosporangium sp. CA-135522]|uniref:glycosyl hydrolase n=1 Tax=Streptosporangium sp. CA-135522 TaxID=3240072 RepID=UPI003D8B46F7